MGNRLFEEETGACLGSVQQILAPMSLNGRTYVTDEGYHIYQTEIDDGIVTIGCRPHI